ncbi:MAG TPA: DMT family transporter [Steroidobacteraceae bacterium]|nr:DMT family transporter [Steroidobacteraceae bacterium]
MLVIAPRDLAFLVLINLIWGFNLIASKVGVGEFPPMLFTAMRFALLAVILLPFLRVRPGEMGPVVVAAIMSGALHFALLFVGVGMSESMSSVAVVGQLGVPFTTLMSIVFLNEVVRWRRWLGITLSFAGVMVIGLEPQVFQHWPGLALVVLSAFIGSIGLMAVKKLQGWKPLELQAWFTAISTPVLIVLTFTFETGHHEAVANATVMGWAALAFTALIASLIAHTGYYYLVQRYPVTSVSPLTVLSPVFGVFFAITLLDEELTSRMVVGAVMTLTGVFIVALRERKIIETGT